MRNVWRLLAAVVCMLGLVGHASSEEAARPQTIDLGEAGKLEVSVQSRDGQREATFTLKPAAADPAPYIHCCCNKACKSADCPTDKPIATCTCKHSEPVPLCEKEK